MHKHNIIFGLAACLLSAVQISDTQNEYDHNAGNSFKRSGKHDPYHLSLNKKNVGGDYKDYPDYGQDLHPESSKIQWENTRRRGLLETHNVSSVHRRREQSVVEVSRDHFHLVEKWPDASKHLGQLSAVSVDMDGNIVVFHRGDRTWNGQTFLPNNVYNERDLGPIPQNTVVVFNASTGKVVREWGSNMFYMPHGLTVDQKNNVWLTDVALHQVFKFSSTGSPANQPEMTLGTRFLPGNDDAHFCKPSDTAITSTGEFFVSDGYCNTRVIKYSKTGKLLMEWGRSTFRSGIVGQMPAPYEFSVPHAMALAEDKNLLFVADRENGRIQCFNYHNGSYVMQFHSPRMGSRLFSVAYSQTEGGLLYIVNGPDDTNEFAHGFVIALNTKQIIEEFGPNAQGFRNPHDVGVTPDGTQAYVVELNPFKVWKFVKGNGNLNNDLKMKTDAALVVTNLSTILSNAHKPPVTNLSQVIIQPPQKTVQSSKSVTTALSIIIAVIAILVIVMTVAVIRMRKRGYLSGYKNSCNRWEFPNSPVEGFKLGQFLDRHQGFEKVNTEESDDEGSSGSMEILTQPTQFA